MFTRGINFKNFKIRGKNFSKINQKLLNILHQENQIFASLKKNYKSSYTKNFIRKYKKYSNFRIIGMGGSILGTQTIYNFLNNKIKKNFDFIDNIQVSRKQVLKKNITNVVISKSGNTLETIINSNLYIKRKDKNIFLTENKDNQLYLLANKLKAEVIHHNNFIGGRYSVLSEVGMLPAELMGLKSSSFRQFNSLVKNKNFINKLFFNVKATLDLIHKKKFNSIIINYDPKSESLFKWYQQLVAESLGKNGKGLLPIISNMPKDNHSVMQLYLDGFKNNFFTFFYVKEKGSEKLNNTNLLADQKFLKNKNLVNILYTQKKATEKIFSRKNIPFRSFEIKERNEKTLGELFCFFILETILIGKSLKLNPYNQPAVELIKEETSRILKN